MDNSSHAGHGEAEDGEDAHAEEGGVEFEERLLTTRLWNSFDLSDSSELELGFSAVFDNLTTQDSADVKKELYAVDTQFSYDLADDSRIRLLLEGYSANYKLEHDEDGEEEEGEKKTMERKSACWFCVINL